MKAGTVYASKTLIGYDHGYDGNIRRVYVYPDDQPILTFNDKFENWTSEHQVLLDGALNALNRLKELRP